MFCLMDVSASMTEPLKDLAKRFFMLLNVFLTRHYREVDVVFIRHTTEAQEVDEDTFFAATSTGGTIISTALDEMKRIVAERYPMGDWNIYAAQASDGHNVTEDMERCVTMLEDELLPACQHFAYIEVGTPGMSFGPSSVVWNGYTPLAGRNEKFAMRQVAEPGEIYPVFRDLFEPTSPRLRRLRARMTTEAAILPAPSVHTTKPLFEGSEWTFPLIKTVYDAIEEIGVARWLKPLCQ